MVFTGRVSEIGVVIDPPGTTVTVRARGAADALEPGGSVAISGVRLTVTAIDADDVRASVSTETRHRSVAAEWQVATPVNVELPLRVGDPVDGHFVRGHVESVGRVVHMSDLPVGRRVWIRAPHRFTSQLRPKSAIAVDGVSLAVGEVEGDRFSVVLVPVTMASTTLSGLAVAQRVNLESDPLAAIARAPGEATSAARVAVARLPWAGQVDGAPGVDKALAQIRAGGAVVVWDPDRECEGDIVLAADAMDAGKVAFLLTTACGHTTVPCAPEVLSRLDIEPLPGPGDRQGTAPHVPVDLATSVGTGVSAAERAATMRRIADPAARPADFLRPGHVFPLRARPGGLSDRRGHTEAAVDLCRAAGRAPVGVISEVMRPDGVMADAAELELLALRWGLPMVTIDDLVAHL